MALKDELDSIWLWAKIKLIPQEFIALIQDKLARFSAEDRNPKKKLLSMKLKSILLVTMLNY